MISWTTKELIGIGISSLTGLDGYTGMFKEPPNTIKYILEDDDEISVQKQGVTVLMGETGKIPKPEIIQTFTKDGREISNSIKYISEIK